MDAATQRALAEIPPPTPDSPAGTALRAYLALQARAFLRHNADGDALWSACSRTTSALAVCARLMEGDWAADLRASVAATAAFLGAERDAAAVRARVLEPLERWITDGAYPDGGAARARTLLTRILDRDRTTAHGASTAALVAPSFHALADRMATLARDVPLTALADLPCVQVLPALIAEPYRRLLSAVSGLPDPLAADDPGVDDQWLDALLAAEAALHAAEMGRPVGLAVLGHTSSELVVSLEVVTAALRDQQDAVLAATCVHRAADTPRIAAATGYALGRLHAEQRMAVLRSRCAAPWDELGQRNTGASGIPGPSGASEDSLKGLTP